MSEQNNADEREQQERENERAAREWMEGHLERAEELMKEILGEDDAAEQAGEDALNGGNVIDNLVGDPANPPAVRMVSGYLGASTREGDYRLYASLDMSEYLEIPKEALYRYLELPTEFPVEGLPIAKVWLKVGKEVTSVTNESVLVQQQFLRGEVAGTGKSGCGCGAGARCVCGHVHHPCCVCGYGHAGGYGAASHEGGYLPLGSRDRLLKWSSRAPC
jgi:hypothetical protein